MTAKGLLDVGDIITSPKFAYGYRDSDIKNGVYIDGYTVTQPITCYASEEERVALAAKTGTIPPKTRVEEWGAYDSTRTSSKFVVIDAKMGGGGTGHGPHDVFPDGWHVQARRLDDDGTYNPNGELIRFYMSGSFMCKVEPEDVRVVGKMQQPFA